MSKRIFTVLLTLGLLATSSAFASRAKLAVMGTGEPVGTAGFGINNRGSLFYDASDNIFYNPSYANDFKNWATVEKANGVAGAADAEGGFAGTFSNFNFGFYMNREDAIVGTYATNTAGPPVVNTMRPFDFFVASDMGMKWGLGVSMASNKASATADDAETVLRLGAQYMDFEPYVNFMLTGLAKTAAGQTKNNHMVVGMRYKMGDWTPFAAYRQDKATTTVTGVTGSAEVKSTDWGLGVGRSMKLAEGASMNYGVGFWRTSGKTTTVAGGVTTVAAGASVMNVPVNMSLEGDFNSWLTGRAGLTYNLVNRVNDVSTGDGTTGRIGATIHAGKADFDWAVGHGASGAAEDVDGNSFAFDSGFFTAASMTYRW